MYPILFSYFISHHYFYPLLQARISYILEHYSKKKNNNNKKKTTTNNNNNNNNKKQQQQQKTTNQRKIKLTVSLFKPTGNFFFVKKLLALLCLSAYAIQNRLESFFLLPPPILSICLSDWLSIYLSVFLPLSLSLNLAVCLSLPVFFFVFFSFDFYHFVNLIYFPIFSSFVAFFTLSIYIIPSFSILTINRECNLKF